VKGRGSGCAIGGGSSGKAGSKGSDVVANPPPVRGKAGKLKKQKGKYAEQDEEDRALSMELLGSAGKSKRQLKQEEAQREREQKAGEAEAKKERQAARQQREQQREHQREKRALAVRDGGEGAAESGVVEGDDAEEAAESFSELAQLLVEPSVAELAEERRAALGAQDTLTGLPAEQDELLFAVPVCAPYSVLAPYTYKLKLTPGNNKRGKAAKQAVGLLSSAAPTRERELMRALTDDELVRAMIGNVKVAAPAKLLQQQKSAEKRERKERATERVKESLGKQKQNGPSVGMSGDGVG